MEVADINKVLHYMPIRVFHKQAKLALLPALCCHIFAVFFFFAPSVNVKLEIREWDEDYIQGYKFDWTGSYLMAQVKQSWKCWHFCIAESL